MSGFPAIVFDADPRRPWLAERSVRSVKRAGAREVFTVNRDEKLPAVDGAVLMIRAGAWLLDPKPLTPPPASATGKPVIAIGIPTSSDWCEVQRRHGGDFSNAQKLPPIVAAWTPSGPLSLRERVRVRAAAPSKCAGTDDPHALTPTLSRREREEIRIVHWPAIDVEESNAPDRLRVVQIVTSLQQGGAERVTWDLNDLLPGFGVDSLLVTLGRPTRKPLPPPGNLVDISAIASDRRADVVAELAARFGADAIHAHLVRADDAERMAQDGVPLVVTAHNTRQGWPEGLKRTQAALTVACSRAVERDLIEARLGSATRTAWNGIDVGAFAHVETKRDAGTLTLVCVANPRPQKRLDRLAAVLAAVRTTRDARLIVCGELPHGPEDPGGARTALREMLDEAKRLGVERFIEFTDGKGEVRDALAGADVFISLSAHEGLSLAQLEALAAGVPVVTTDVGGASEVAHANPAVTLLPVDVSSCDAAQAIVTAATMRSDAATIRPNFSREKMADRYAWLYRAAVHGPPRGETLWFVANNLCTGGAQSSLRRLVKSLHAQGRPVRVAVLQEHPDHPTPGREDLLRAGVPVTVLPPAGSLDVAEAVELLLAEMRSAPPRSVTFWNAIQSYKLLIADALLRVPVLDVSPGEMFYDSMEKYFAAPRGGLPYRTPREYGERLAGLVVKYAAEAERARATLGAPVHLIPNGVPLAPQDVPPRVSRDRFVIGTATRLHPHKRVEDLLDAFRLARPKLPNSVLRIAGGADAGCDEYAESLRSNSADLPVEWLGEIGGDVAAFHAGLDVFAMISEPAGCPNASLEAMAAGLPVAATDVGGAGEQVVDGVTGRLVPPRDVQMFADALVQLGTCPDCRGRFGIAARRRVVERFSLDRMRDDYLALLDGEFTPSRGGT